MNALFEKLDQLSSPLGSLLDAALNRLAPHTTASACGGVLCYVTCGGVCGPCCGHQIEYLHYAPSAYDCNHHINITQCPNGCRCY
jgi:hypothetical protein